MEQTNYSKIDHTHCFDQKESPCGIQGKHRCCLCNEPVPSQKPMEHIQKREIKVKFWNGKKMSPAYELLDLLYEGVPSILQDTNGELDTNPKSLAKIVTLEWTGLLDKNGKEIYEGDIVVVRISEVYGGTDDDEGNAEYLCTQEVKASKSSGGYYTIEDTGEYCPGLGSDEIEIKIIGNIYENPDLLE